MAGVDAQAAEGEGDAAADLVGLEGRLVERVRPVRLRHGKAHGAAAVLDVRVERHVGADGGVVGAHLVEEGRRIDALELRGELLERVGRDLGDALDAVLVAQEVQDLAVEDLPGELVRLLEDHAAVLGVGVVAEVGALVDEALARGVDHDAERVGVLLEGVADRKVAELGGVVVPADGVAAGPVAGRRGADVERHADAVAGVEAGAAHLRELPARAEVAGAPLGVRFEAAAGEDHGPGLDVVKLALLLHAHPGDRMPVVAER